MTDHAFSISQRDWGLLGFLQNPSHSSEEHIISTKSSDIEIFVKPIERDISLNSQITRLMSGIMNSGIFISNNWELISYLRQHPDMINAVNNIYESAKDTFGKEHELSLEVYHDPEEEDDHLVLYVRRAAYGDGFMDGIRTFRRQFHASLKRLSGRIHITTDYQSPKA